MENIPKLLSELNSISDKISEAGRQWVQANQIYKRYDQLKKSVLAQEIIKLKAKDVGSKRSMASLETSALGSSKYTEWLERLVNAESEALNSKVLYEALKDRQEALRTLISHAKIEMRSLER